MLDTLFVPVVPADDPDAPKPVALKKIRASSMPEQFDQAVALYPFSGVNPFVIQISTRGNGLLINANTVGEKFGTTASAHIRLVRVATQNVGASVALIAAALPITVLLFPVLLHTNAIVPYTNWHIWMATIACVGVNSSTRRVYNGHFNCSISVWLTESPHVTIEVDASRPDRYGCVQLAQLARRHIGMVY
jgi:hypothetical protein